MKFGLPEKTATITARTGPVFAVVVGIAVVAGMGLQAEGVKILGDVPRNLPTLGMPEFDREIWLQLLGSAALISLIGFVESVSVGQTLAVKKRDRIDPNQETDRPWRGQHVSRRLIRLSGDRRHCALGGEF